MDLPSTARDSRDPTLSAVAVEHDQGQRDEEKSLKRPTPGPTHRGDMMLLGATAWSSGHTSLNHSNPN
jgi:hypothetical protein